MWDRVVVVIADVVNDANLLPVMALSIGVLVCVAGALGIRVPRVGRASDTRVAWVTAAAACV